MPPFKGFDFQIELPHGSTDESTYAFAFPGRGSFRPSVVVKTERLGEPIQLEAYVEKQLGTLEQVLPKLVVASGTSITHDDLPAYVSVFDWGEPEKRVRQKQRYIVLRDPARIVTITGTHLREDFDQADALFDAVFKSFHAGEK